MNCLRSHWFLSCYISDQKKLKSGNSDTKSKCTSDDFSVQMNKNEVYGVVKGTPTQDIYEN